MKLNCGAKGKWSVVGGGAQRFVGFGLCHESGKNERILFLADVVCFWQAGCARELFLKFCTGFLVGVTHEV